MKIKKILIFLGLTVVAAMVGFGLYLAPGYEAPILMYHHIDGQGARSSLSVSPENFARQLEFLSRRNYHVVSLTELVRAKLSKQAIRRNSVAITFDDGYEDNYISAYPVLKRYHLPATIFVIVDKIGQRGYLSYRQIEEMLNSGLIEIASHSLSGAYLPGRRAEELEREISQSKRRLEQVLNRPVRLFCYPIGGFTPQIQAIVKESGYQAACSTNRGSQQTYLNNDLFALKRVKIKDGPANLFVFWVKLSGYYNLFRRVREPH